MILAVNLRKLSRLGEVRLVTARAQYTGIRQLWSYRRRVRRMICERSVTGFAIYACVLARLLDGEDVRVAVLAGAVSRVPQFSCGEFFQRIASVVSVLSEAFRDKLCSGQDE